MSVLELGCFEFEEKRDGSVYCPQFMRFGLFGSMRGARSYVLMVAKYKAQWGGFDYAILTIRYEPECPFPWVEGDVEKVSVSAREKRYGQ